MSQQDSQLNSYKKIFKEEETALLDEYFTFLRFPTISADPAMQPVLQSCAKWLATDLTHHGFQTELWNEHEAPVVFASNCEAGPSKPTLLIYNHYDVQPVDPLELWKIDPFQPKKEGNLIFARGAQDNKGQCFYVMTALKAYLKHNKKFPINIKFIIEGEEESGSSSLSRLLQDPKKLQALQSDFLFIVDLGMRSAHIPAITLGTRGLTSLEIDVFGTNTDLHSGSHGGIAYNPLHAIVELLSKLRDAEGHIQVPGFYDNVLSPTKKELEKLNFNFNVEEYKMQFGAAPTGGEKKYLPLERNWLRPTIEINGIGGGYQGPGGKTVIPAHAHAKLSCRLVPNQEPAQIAEQIKNYLEKLAPNGTKVQVIINEGMGKPVRTNPESAVVKALEMACTQVWSHSPEYILEGASIPIVSELAAAIKAETAMFGLGMTSDNIHAPNECFGWDRVEKGFLTICTMIDSFQC